MFKITIGKKAIPIILLLNMLTIAMGMVTAQEGSTVYYACVNNDSGQISMVRRSDSCESNETKIGWNMRGPSGPQGVQGVQGDPGPAGPHGPPGESALLALAGQSCPGGQSIYGFDEQGNMLCSAAGAPSDFPPTETVTPMPDSAVDVILVVDTSADMVDEVAMVESALNGFATTIENTGIDLHITLLGNENKICIPAPLGSGICGADENLPRFRHVPVSIGSDDVFSSIIDSSDLWVRALRPEAARHLIVISSGNPSGINAWEQFDTNFSYLGPYTFHAVAADFAGHDFYDPCYSYNGGPAEERGTEYIELVHEKGGVLVNLCDQDLLTGFQDIGSAIISSTGG